MPAIFFSKRTSPNRTVTGKLQSNLSLIQIFMDLFPGGSITGTPKIRAMQIAAILESVQRDIFCGSLLLLSENDRLDSNIMIRTAAFEENQNDTQNSDIRLTQLSCDVTTDSHKQQSKQTKKSEFERRKVYLWAGSGIIHESQAHTEADEVTTKIKLMMEILKQPPARLITQIYSSTELRKHMSEEKFLRTPSISNCNTGSVQREKRATKSQLKRRRLYWLLTVQAFTPTLKKIYPALRIELLSEGSIPIYSDEKDLLKSDHSSDIAWVRTVLIWNHTQPMCFARVVVSNKMFETYQIDFQNLSNKPLGETLFF